jgi:hypothetical protein
MAKERISLEEISNLSRKELIEKAKNLGILSEMERNFV